MADPLDDVGSGLTRREWLRHAGIAGAAAAVAPIGAFAAERRSPQGDPLENLTAPEAAVLDAIVARLIPTDENGPGAREARAARYIDRALGGALAASRDAYRTGLAAVDAHAQRAKGGVFATLSARDQDDVLLDMERNTATGFTPSAAYILQPASHTHVPGHVRRSVLRRQRELRRVGSAGLSRPAACRQRRRSAARREADSCALVRLRSRDVLTATSASGSHAAHQTSWRLGSGPRMS